MGIKPARSTNLRSHGQLTAKVAQKITQDLTEKGYDVLSDHSPSSENVGKIVSWYGLEYIKSAELSQLDIAIVKRNSNKAIALIEIEETSDRPKTLLGDALCALMGEHFCFGGKRQILVDEQTTLIILGKSEVSDRERCSYLCEKAMEIKSNLSTGNSIIGNVVIESFSDEKGLSTRLSSLLDRAYQEELLRIGN